MNRMKRLTGRKILLATEMCIRDRSKEDTTNSRRVVFSNLQDKIAVTELFKEISVKIADRPGGYTLSLIHI